jgi:hypothetical protein
MLKGNFISEETRKRMSIAKKGHPPYFTTKGKEHPMWGKHHSEEVKKKMSEAHKKIKITWRDKINSTRKEHPYQYTEEIKKKMSMNRKGKGKGNTNGFKKGMKPWNTGIKMKPFSDKVRIHMANSHKGSKSHFWRGGVYKEHLIIRGSVEYVLWRESVFKRDNYTCIWCGDKRGGNLEADHIKPFAFYPELRFAIDNGRTLCHKCHQTTDTYGRKTNYR